MQVYENDPVFVEGLGERCGRGYSSPIRASWLLVRVVNHTREFTSTPVRPVGVQAAWQWKEVEGCSYGILKSITVSLGGDISITVHW